MCSGCKVEQNIKRASSLIRAAHAAGARFIATPEMTNILAERERVVASVKREDEDPAPRLFGELASELSIYLLIGSVALKSEAEALVNRSLLFAPDGKIAARYDKIHMFDVTLGDGLKFRESDSYRAGSKAVVADISWGRIGMTICYDVRFAHLYRSLAQAGAYIISVPSAFTQPTGEAHWHLLLQARAIENAVFIAAPAQSGQHEGGRQTYGHSLVVGPWGEILADAGTEEGIAVVTIEPKRAAEARSRLPALSHDTSWELVQVARSQVMKSHDPL
jgi:hypothetical protein